MLLIKTFSLLLAYCRSRLFFFMKNDISCEKPFPSCWPIAAGAFFLMKNGISYEKCNILNFNMIFLSKNDMLLMRKVTFFIEKHVFLKYKFECFSLKKYMIFMFFFIEKNVILYLKNVIF